MQPAGAYLRWSNASGSNYEIIIVRHSSRSFHNLPFIIANHFYTFQIDAEGEAEFGKICRVCVDGLNDD